MPEDNKDKGGNSAAQPKTYSEDEFKQVVAQRQELKDKLRAVEDAERKRSEDKLIEEKKFTELISQRDAELARIKQEFESVSQVANQFKEQQQKMRDAALAKIQDAKMKDIASELSTAKLLEFVDQLETNKSLPFSGKAKTVVTDDNPLKIKPGESAAAYEARVNKFLVDKQKSK